MLHGSCLCGGIRYEIDGPVGVALNFHCSMCRKWHGTAYRARLSVPQASFRFIQGEDLLAEYRSSASTTRCFCRVCGSPLFSLWTGEPDSYGLAMGTLDDDPGVRPSCHIYVASKAPWFDIGDGLPQYAEEPPQD
jgi:hypothetical protein